MANNLARVFPDRRDPTRVVHSLVDMFRARMFAICCGYEDADDLDHLRSDPAFKLACGRLPDTGRDLCSQPTLDGLALQYFVHEHLHRTSRGSNFGQFCSGFSVRKFGGLSG
ncbi:hypothetical protein ACVIU7_007969 [Bradyrhizobium liaoningense]